MKSFAHQLMLFFNQSCARSTFRAEYRSICCAIAWWKWAIERFHHPMINWTFLSWFALYALEKRRNEKCHTIPMDDGISHENSAQEIKREKVKKEIHTHTRAHICALAQQPKVSWYICFHINYEFNASSMEMKCMYIVCILERQLRKIDWKPELR